MTTTGTARDLVGRTVTLTIDHPYGSTHPVYGFIYHANYGHVDQPKNPHADTIAAYYLGEHTPLEIVTGECIAIVCGQEGDKLIVVPPGMELSDRAITAAVSFQEIHGSRVIARTSPIE